MARIKFLSRKKSIDFLDARGRKEYERAAKLFEDFTGHRAEPFALVDLPIAPKVGLVIGSCDGILYSTVRDGKLEKYIHEFAKKDRPILVSSSDGRQLFLLFGNFRFTERGIVDRSSRAQ